MALKCGSLPQDAGDLAGMWRLLPHLPHWPQILLLKYCTYSKPQCLTDKPSNRSSHFNSYSPQLLLLASRQVCSTYSPMMFVKIEKTQPFLLLVRTSDLALKSLSTGVLDSVHVLYQMNWCITSGYSPTIASSFLLSFRYSWCCSEEASVEIPNLSRPHLMIHGWSRNCWLTNTKYNLICWHDTHEHNTIIPFLQNISVVVHAGIFVWLNSNIWMTVDLLQKLHNGWMEAWSI